MRTLVPGYPAVMGKFRKKKPVLHYPSLQGGTASVLAAQVAGLDLLVLDAPHLFDRPGGPYGDMTGADWPDNWRRFAALSQVGAEIAAGAVPGWQPDIVHAHDWQAALTLAYMRFGRRGRHPTVMTVHNLAFQGQFGAGDLRRARPAGRGHGARRRRILRRRRLPQGRPAGGAGAITTVSPTYAQEIRTPEFGMGLDGLVATRSADLVGIVNGIDTDIWNPGDRPAARRAISRRSR